MIKVYHVLTDTNIGGAGRWLINLLKNIDRNKYDIKVILPYNSQLKNHIEGLNVSVCELEDMKNKSFDPKAIKQLYKIFKDEKVDIVHTHASLSARIAARLAKVKGIVNTKHCIDIVEHNIIKRKIKVFINKIFSNKIIAISNAVRSNLLEQDIPNKMIELIYNGIEPMRKIDEEEKSILKAKYNISDEIVVGNVARLEEIKGQKYYIEAANEILKANKNVKFLIIGTGSDEKKLKALVEKLNLSQNIIFTGYIKEIDKMMNIIDINVISSISEALCLSILEGMSLGKVAVGTDSGGVKEIIYNDINGYIVSPANSYDLAEAILKLIQNKQLRIKMGEQGKKIVKEKFTANIMTDKIEKIYDSLTRRKK